MPAWEIPSWDYEPLPQVQANTPHNGVATKISLEDSGRWSTHLSDSDMFVFPLSTPAVLLLMEVIG
jgi:hypothetical protein